MGGALTLIRSNAQVGSKSKHPVLSFAQLREGYVQTIENAIRFFSASTDLIKAFPEKALALGELGQEEVGRSLTLLAAFSLPTEADAWEWFWKAWNNHQVKAHRAYLYEIISPLRLEIEAPKGRRFPGEPLRPKTGSTHSRNPRHQFRTNAFTTSAQDLSQFAPRGLICFLCIRRNANELCQSLPMPWMRAVSTCADVGLRTTRAIHLMTQFWRLVHWASRASGTTSSSWLDTRRIQIPVSGTPHSLQ